MRAIKKSDIFPWVELALGHKITESKRPPMRSEIPLSRNDWIIKTQGGEKRKAKWYVRCDRDADFRFVMRNALLRESEILKVLHSEGIPVPRVIAESSNPRAVILEFVDGSSDFSGAKSPAEIDAVTRDFARIMARWHEIPAERFARIGLEPPRSDRDCVLGDLEALERRHLSHVREPIPLVSFVCKWLRNHMPPPPERPVLIQGDTGPGQFIHKKGRVQAVIDWEMATLGDPLWDLATIRRRDAWSPTGNLPRWFEYYSEYSGRPLDQRKLRYYSVSSAFIFALTLGQVIQNLKPGDEHMDLISMNLWSKRVTMEELAAIGGVKLAADIALPTLDANDSSSLFDILESNLVNEQLPRIKRKLIRHRMKMTVRLALHLRAVAELGRDIENLELEDMGSLLERRPATLREGRVALDELVRAAGPDADDALVAFFHRQTLREQALTGGAMGWLEKAGMADIS